MGDVEVANEETEYALVPVKIEKGLDVKVAFCCIVQSSVLIHL